MKQVRIAVIMLLCIAAGTVIGYMGTGLGTGENSVPPDAIRFYGNEALRVMETPVPMSEFMLYALDVRREYDEAHENAWWAEMDENADGIPETHENIVKENIAESIRMVKVLCRAAEPEFGISLSEDEESLMERQAENYHGELVKNGVDEEFLTLGVVTKFIREGYLSRKVYERMTETYGTTDTGGDAREEPSGELVNALAELMEKYDGDYDYLVNINWELMNQFRFYEPYEPTAGELQDAVDELLKTSNTSGMYYNR